MNRMKKTKATWRDYKAYKSKKAKTKPIKPLTSTKLKPIKLHLINVFDNTGLRLIESNKNENISPTPIPTPANEIKGILDAKYLNPNNIIKNTLGDVEIP